MKLIELSRGLFAKVDDEDYEGLSSDKWQAIKGDTTFYASRTVRCSCCKRQYAVSMHRKIMGVVFDACKQVDHKDGDGLNNQKENLRLCTTAHNSQNRGKRSDGAGSKYKGVSFFKGDKLKIKKWYATIRGNGALFNLGFFLTEEEAAMAYNKKALELHGEFAKLNVLDNVQIPERKHVTYFLRTDCKQRNRKWGIDGNNSIFPNLSEFVDYFGIMETKTITRRTKTDDGKEYYTKYEGIATRHLEELI